MRILMVNYEFPPIGGGAANANECLLKEFASIGGVQVDLVTSFAGKGVAVEQLADGINVHKVGIAKKNLHHWRKTEVLEWMFRAGGVYNDLLAKNEYDLAHSFFAFPSGWFCWRSRKKLPYIISLRGSDVPGYNDTLGLDYLLLSRLFKSIWNNSASIVANSSGLASLARKFTPQLEVDVIPNGVFVDDFSKISILKNAGSPIKLLTVGRLVNRKRTDIAIEAVALLNSQGLDVSLDIAGDGVMVAQLKSLAARLGIAEKVNFLGIVAKNEMPQIYAKADIFVMCSEHEGMSNALLEAMASSLPIITSNCEGVGELVDGNGVVVEDIATESFASAAIKLINDSSMREKMATISRQRAEQFSWRNVALAYVDQYKRIQTRRT